MSSGQIWLQNQHNVILLQIFNKFCPLWSSVQQRKILLKPTKLKCEIPLHTSIRRVRLDLVLVQLTDKFFQFTESSRKVRPTVTNHFLWHTSLASKSSEGMQGALCIQTKCYFQINCATRQACKEAKLPLLTLHTFFLCPLINNVWTVCVPVPASALSSGGPIQVHPSGSKRGTGSPTFPRISTNK